MSIAMDLGSKTAAEMSPTYASPLATSTSTGPVGYPSSYWCAQRVRRLRPIRVPYVDDVEPPADDIGQVDEVTEDLDVCDLQLRVDIREEDRPAGVS